MKIGVITRREKAHKSGSVMQETVMLLQARGVDVEMIYPEDTCLDIARINDECDLYLLKSGSATALSFAGVLDARGARMINSYPSVVAIRDKIISTKRLLDAGVPLPATYFAANPLQLIDLLKEGSLVIKPYWAASQGRGVEIVGTAEELKRIENDAGLTFAQRYHRAEGLDHKLYVIGEEVFGVRRVWPPKSLEEKLGEPFDVTAEMGEIALRCGQAFGAGLYGVDLITSDGRPYVVDINTFPGFKGVPHAAALLADYILGYEM
jgi:ribosomal protein S6--L-glutamate ligase